LLPDIAENLPQVVESNTPQLQDAAGECLLYHEVMTRVFVADAKPEERAALRLVLLDLKMEVAGEAADWVTTLTQVPISNTNMLLIEWDLLPSPASVALEELRRACPTALVIVLISYLDARQQAALSAGADAFISKGELPERVAERLRTVAAGIRTLDVNLLNEKIENQHIKIVPSAGAIGNSVLQGEDLEDHAMDKNEFEGKWEIIKDQSKVWWSLITDDDLKKVEQADIKFFEYVTLLQLKYGYDRQVAKDEVAKHVAEYDTKLKVLITTRP
jgi:DNA-binding NarL/FixJ family response regulator